MTETKMQLLDWLDDLCVRFIVNLPQEELESVARICFQVEEAQWFYEDFIRPTDPSLPSLNLRDFCLRIFQHCPLLSAFSDSQHTAAYQEFLAYKTRVPVRGAILLNDEMDHVVLVKGWKKGATWSFPRGKINKDEPDLDCAIREVWEETGYDIGTAGLVQQDQKYIDVTMREQHLRMFVFRGVPTDTLFEPKTRKEISKIKWYRLTDLPSYNQKKQNRLHQDANGEHGSVSANKLYMVAPFLPPLKKWINQQRKRDAARSAQVDLLAEEPHGALSGSLAPEPEIRAEVAVDPAAELKRLLSVNAPVEEVAHAAEMAEANQAQSLLAMLKGGPSSGGLAPPAVSHQIPVTPLEQVTATPLEPDTPHYHHAKPSPAVRQQPPPAFPFPLSPAQNYNGSHQPPNDFDMNAHQNLQRILPQHSQAPPPEFMRGADHMHHPSSHAQPQHPLLPQGHESAFAHGPVAPAPSQLPPPRLTNHTMGLLNAFRAPSYMQRSPAANVHPALHNQGPAAFSNQGQPFAQAQMQGHSPMPGQANMAGFPPANVPPRSAHQNSLLGLFKSPEAPKATPVPQAAPVPQIIQQSPQPPISTSSAETPKQRSVTLAMMTRTLPKAKAVPTPPPGKESGNQFPAKHIVQQAQAAHARSISEAQHRTPGSEASRPPVAILPRPGSAATKPSPAPPRPEVAPSPAKTRTQRGSRNGPPSNFTILQRPSPLVDQIGSPGTPERRQPIPPQPAVQEAPKQFQPQILQRPRSEESGRSGQGQEQPPQNHSDQRNTLLSLFAKSNLGTGHGEGRSGSALSSNSAAGLPSDPSAFRTRLASTSSAVSSVHNDGLKSPSTPVEAKGFLLDYLNGVVKNEKYKGSKQGQF